jgi:hypothetical protein
MKEKEFVRRYRYSDADLKQLATNQLALIQRDIIEFNDMGFNATRQAEYEAALTHFINFPTDNQYEGLQMSATQKKNENRELLKSAVRNIQFIAEIAFEKDFGKRREFGDADLTRQSDNDLIQTAFETKTIAQKYAQELSSDGLTPAKISQLQDHKDAFAEAILGQKQAINERDIKTRERVEASNNVYDLVVRYGKIGRNIWESTNSSKYNDYIIYDENQSHSGNDEQADDINEPTNGLI